MERVTEVAQHSHGPPQPGESSHGSGTAPKWGMPLYGVKDRGWFVSCGVVATDLRVTFFQGASLRPVPPLGKPKQLRGVAIRGHGEFDEARLASWVRQAARLPGYGS